MWRASCISHWCPLTASSVLTSTVDKQSFCSKLDKNGAKKSAHILTWTSFRTSWSLTKEVLLRTFWSTCSRSAHCPSTSMWTSIASYVRIPTSRRCINANNVRARSRMRSLNRTICGIERMISSNLCVSNFHCSWIQGKNALGTLTCAIFRLKN